MLKSKINGVHTELAKQGFFEENPVNTKVLVQNVHSDLAKAGFFEEKKETIVRKMTTWQWALAASLAILVVAGLWLSIPKPAVDTLSVANDFFQPETKQLAILQSQLSGQGMANDAAANKMFSEALNLYQSKQLAAAEKAFITYQSQFPQADHQASRFYLATSLVGQNKDLPKAIDMLKNLSNSDWAAESEWYLALAYLKNSQNTEGGVLLKKIAANEQSDYKKEADNLLNALGQ